MAMTRLPHLHNHTPSKSPELLANSYQVFGCSSAQSRVPPSGREHSAKLLLRVLRVPRDPAPSPKPTAGANRTTRASPAEGFRQRHQPKPPETQPQRRYMQATHSQVLRLGQQRAPVMSQSTGAPRRTRGPTQLPVRARLAFPVLGIGVMAEGAKVAEPISAVGR